MSTVIVPFAIVVLVVIVALFFDFMNGFHDAANSIATVVSTRVLSPRMAVLWAALANFIALFIFKEGVADTIAKTIHIDVDAANLTVEQLDMLRTTYVWIVICGLLGA